jgi:predicted Ser/Thr protein kinase
MGPGSALGDFVIESVAGRGGMGVVYRARQRNPERIVALKVISAELADDPQFRTRFQGEAAIAAQIEHPNVIPVYAVGEADGTLYIAMRFVDGMDLRALLARDRALEPARAVLIIDQVARALDAAHARGLVHRDVKPANILVASGDDREHVYLSDFGLSRPVASSHGLTGTGAFIGTIDYVAPEQARGERVDARADVYSLGCVLFQTLTGTVPFPVENDLAKLYAHSSQPTPSVLERKPDVPQGFDGVLRRAMAKQPDDRYQSAGDLGRAAIAASSGSEVPLPEGTVAIGAAAPLDDTASGARASAVTSPRAAATAVTSRRATPGAGGHRRRRLAWAGAALAALAAAVVAVVVISGGSGRSSVSTLSLTPVQSQSVAPIPNRHPVQDVSVKAPGGYEYRLALDTIDAPRGSNARTLLPLYLTLRARRGATPLVTVQRLKLPSIWRWTRSSIVASFTLDPDPDGSGQVGLSWYPVAGDRSDVTHYLTVGPQGIQID